MKTEVLSKELWSWGWGVHFSILTRVSFLNASVGITEAEVETAGKTAEEVPSGAQLKCLLFGCFPGTLPSPLGTFFGYFFRLFFQLFSTSGIRGLCSWGGDGKPRQ